MEVKRVLPALPFVLTTGLVGYQFAAPDDGYTVRLHVSEGTRSGEPVRGHLVDFPTASAYSAHPVETTINTAISHVEMLASGLPEVDEDLDGLVDSLVEGFYSRQKVAPLTRTI